MAASQEGYKCEFIDPVTEDFKCKKCALVARSISLTSCCTENFCQNCITATQEQEVPCPMCGEKEFTVIKHVRNQKKIKNLKAYCSMKERGCAWSGTVDQLDTHLDPHMDNCEYMDTKCPLNCRKTVPKNKMDQHVAQQCSKRPHVCQHCGFKASYEEVVDTHLPECKYVPLQCPNMCGVSCEREVMEDHMKICRLDEVKCEFSSVGCDSRFIRQDQDEHARQNSQKHLTLTASLAVKTKEQLKQKLHEQDKKHREEEDKLRNKVDSQERKIDEQENKLGELVKKIGEQQKKNDEQKKKIGDQEEIIRALEQELNDQRKKQKEQQKKVTELTQSLHEVTAKVYHLSDNVSWNRKYEIKGFSKLKREACSLILRSNAMYTHMCGYKFYIGVQPEIYNNGNHTVGIIVAHIVGEYDDQLKWPINVRIKVEVLNQQGGENISKSEVYTWSKHDVLYTYIPWLLELPHSRLKEVLFNDTLHIQVSNIELL